MTVRLRKRGGSSARWIFHHSKLAWLQTMSGETLPLPLRAFRKYCALQHQLGMSRRIVAGRPVYRALSLLAKVLKVDPHVRLRRGGYVIHLNTRDLRSLYVPGELSTDSQPAELLAKWIQPGDTFLDVGANHGSYSVLAAHLVGPMGLVVAVEPQADLARLVEQSLQEVGGLRFIVMAMALTERQGQVPLYVPRDSSGAAGLYADFSARAAHTVRSVEVASLDDVLPWESFPGRTLMKLDVEGSELAVLRGARRFMRERRPTVLIETNDLTLRAANVEREDLRDEFVAAGYTHISPFPGSGWLPIEEMISVRAANLLVTADRGALEHGAVATPGLPRSPE